MKKFLLLLPFLFNILIAQAQTDDTLKLLLQIPVIDVPQNIHLPYKYPSMQQSLDWSNNFYDLGYMGIDALGNLIINPKKKEFTTSRKVMNMAVKYAISLPFVFYGSDLPIPLGTWSHEQFHRSVLGVNNISSENGNWIFSRWNGTVYGVNDSALADLKTKNTQALLYSYVAGMHAQNLSTRTNLVNDFYQPRTTYKNALYLYNAYYTWNYLNFSAGSGSDSAKKNVPQFEDKHTHERDFAGSDMTAWIYDMFNPKSSYFTRDSFPNGEGVNRRIGYYSDLSTDAQNYLTKQKNLSLLNFINPAIFFVDRINVSPNFSFNFFTQYAPTHFGNDISLVVPMTFKSNNYLFALHNYNNYQNSLAGIEVGVMNRKFSPDSKFDFSTILHGWLQPENQDFFAQKGTFGGALEFGTNYQISKLFSANAYMQAKSKGFIAGNPYLKENVNFRFGFGYDLRK